MNNIRVMEFFERIGLPLTVERGARVFPASMRAQDVTDALLSHLKKSGVRIMTNCDIQKTAKENGIFRIISNGSTVAEGQNLIIATGGLSYPATGSTGSGYRFAEEFGHKITPCFPSLTALIPEQYSELYHGISLKNVEAALYVNGNEVLSEFGDLDFTDGGIEGAIGFRLSRNAVYNLLHGQKVAIRIDLKPAITGRQLEERIKREIQALEPEGRAAIQRGGIEEAGRLILPKLMPKALIKPFLLANRNCINRTSITESLAEKLKNWEFRIISNVGYERCVITAGGVALSEISKKTMESKIVKGLYFAGEVINLDGDTGGYNLQIAFSTAALAAINITNIKR